MKTVAIHATMSSTDDIGVKELERQHRRYGFFTVGFHYVIRRNGKTEAGRPESQASPYDPGVNITICLVGGADNIGAPRDNFTDAQKTELVVLLDQIQKRTPGGIRAVSKTPSVSQPLLDSLFNIK